MKPLLLTIFIFFCLFSPFSSSATLTTVNIEKQGERYILHITVQVNANVDSVKQIITDYENLTSINPYLKESKVISMTDNKRTTVSMLTEACVLFICFKIRHVDIFQRVGDDIIFIRTIPKISDFKEGWSRWTIKEINSNNNKTVTQLSLDSEMVPDFFILPIIGPYQLKKKIIEIASVTINNLEIKAQKINSMAAEN